MCGLFGYVRADGADPRTSVGVFEALGWLSQERGTDAAGFAACTATRTPPTTPSADATLLNRYELDGCTVVKAPYSFTAVWGSHREAHRALLSAAPVGLGHTRLATIGKAPGLCDSSPLVVGRLVGAHNGGVSIKRLKEQFGSLPRSGKTSSEAIFAALHAVDDPVEVLAALRGRAALSWLTRGQTGAIRLARAAISPLATAYDQQGTFYWASNPGWFTRVESVLRETVRFRDVQLVAEGTLLTVGGERPAILDRRTFTPVARQSDVDGIEKFAWYGFSAPDMGLDAANLRHLVDPRAPKVPVRNAPPPPEGALAGLVRLYRERVLRRGPASA